MGFLESIGSFFAAGADDAAREAAGIRKAGFEQASRIIGEGETRSLSEIEKGSGYVKPYYETGTAANNRLAALYGFKGPQEQTDARDEFMVSPGYDFRVGEGTKAIERGVAAKGGLYSGAAGKALLRYGQDEGSKEYANWLAGLERLSGSGQNASTVLNANTGKSADIITNASKGRADALIGASGAEAGGVIGAANAVQGGLNNAIQIGGKLISLATGMPSMGGGGVAGGGMLPGGGSGAPWGATFQHGQWIPTV